MNMRTYLPVITALIFILPSCRKVCFHKKDPEPPKAGNLVRIQQGTDPKLVNDTVHLISYDASGKISQITDSVYHNTLSATYDASGHLIRVLDSRGYNASYSYDANGMLTDISNTWVGEKQRYSFEYRNGIVSKKSYFTDAGSGGALSLWRSFDYIVQGGNITNIKEYNAAGTLLSETTLSFGSQENPFKSLALFNYANNLGFDPLMTFETYFNKNVFTEYKINGQSSTANYVFNTQQQPAKAVVMVNLGGGSIRTLTWQFFYK